MNIDDIKPWIESANSVLTTFKALKDLLPAGQKRDDAERLLKNAERDLKLTEGRIARDLGFQLCPRCWPPEIMLVAADDLLRCRRCGSEPPDDFVFSVTQTGPAI